MQRKRVPIASVLAILAVTAILTATPAAAQHERLLHSFNNNGKDGNGPWGGLVFDPAGNLYGTTFQGGTGGCKYGDVAVGCGTVFELSPKAAGSWSEKVLHNFHGNDGWDPSGNLILDAAGNLYGTTRQGGTGLCRYLIDQGLSGCGTVYELSPSSGGKWTEKVLYNFLDNSADGTEPSAGLVFDASGNLYGTTFQGGSYGYGTVFELKPSAGGGWAETVLHNFNQDGTDGFEPVASLILDGSGNLYGTTEYGGPFVLAGGTVFELTPSTGGSWTETIVHNFNSNIDGYFPRASLIFDATGNLYGTTSFGGPGGVDAEGSAFELSPGAGGTWTETLLHFFNENGVDGATPVADLIFDTAGNLYGTTQYGGVNSYGTVFKLTPGVGGSWNERIVHDFVSTGAGGLMPLAGLARDTAGNLYGTTNGGGAYDVGTVFELVP
jgi:uncharacterized repeat protein (TIGR03803 family)